MNKNTMEKFPYTNMLLEIQLNRLVGSKRVRTIVDVGAFDGSLCSHFSRLYPKAVVHALEPSSKSFRRLSKATKANPCIKIYRLAISDTTGVQTLHVDRSGGKGESSQFDSLFESFVLGKDKATIQCEEVPCSTFDHFCRSENIRVIDLLLLNCEGGEYKLFEGKELDIFNHVRVLSLALHGKSFLFTSEEYVEKKKRINSFLIRYGFQIVYGEDLNTLKRLPTGHISQVWIRE